MSSAHTQPAAHSARTLRCSVIVPVYNGAAVIGRCLDALASQTVVSDQFEIIVVDDGSHDGTAERVECWAAQHRATQLTLVRQAQAGPAAARNRGADIAQAPLLLFTDADCQPTAGWVEALLAGFALPNQPAGLMGAYVSRQRSLAARFAQLEFEDRYQRMARADPVDFVATYSAAFRRDVFMAEGGFDTRYIQNEDVEFSYRLSEAGYRIDFVPEAQVYHWHTRTWPDYATTKAMRGYWRTIVYQRHPGKALKDTYTPQVLKLQIVLGLLAPLGLVLALLRRRPGPLALVAPFLLTTLPFVRFAARRDPLVAAVSPWGLWLRSLAFAVGVAGGMLAGLRAPHDSPRADHRTSDH